MATAPPELKGGFFTSPLGFYDVQSSLARDTLVAVCIAVVCAIVVLMLATFNVVLSLVSVATVAAVIAVSVGALLGLGWKLNILESVAITLIIGLSVDFTLHYAIMYKVSATSRMRRRRKSSCGSSLSQEQQQQQQQQRCEPSSSEADVVFSVSQMAAPVSMAALTTSIAGLCLLPSRVLAYVQIGTFIAVVTSASLVYSTFFLQSLLSVFAPVQNCSVGSATSSEGVTGRAKYLFSNRGSSNEGENGANEGREANEECTEEGDAGDDDDEKCFTVQNVDRDVEVAGNNSDSANNMRNTSSNGTNLSTFTALSAQAPPPPPPPQPKVNILLDSNPPPPLPISDLDAASSVPPQIITVATSYRGDRGRVSTCDIHMSMNDVTVVDGFTGPNGIQLQREELERLSHQETTSLEQLQQQQQRDESNSDSCSTQLAAYHEDGTATLPSLPSKDKKEAKKAHRRALSNSQPKTNSVHFASPSSPTPPPPPPPAVKPIQMVETAIVSKEYRPIKQRQTRSNESLKSPTTQQASLPTRADVEATAAWMARKRQQIQEGRRKTKGSADSITNDNINDAYNTQRSQPRCSDVVLIHCDAPTIRADLVHQKMRRKSGGSNNTANNNNRSSEAKNGATCFAMEAPISSAVVSNQPELRQTLSSQQQQQQQHGGRKYSLAVVKVAPQVQKQRSRLKSLPSNSIEVPPEPAGSHHEDPSSPPPPPLPPKLSQPYQKPRPPPPSKSAKPRDEEAEVVKAVVTHRRKNSYKIAQEKELVGESMRERRKSMGDGLEEGRVTKQHAQRALLSSRNSSSLGNILQEEQQRMSPLNFEEEVLRRPKRRAKNGNKSGGTPSRNSYGAVEQCPTVVPTSVNLRSSYHYERHPLSHSTTTILNANSDDPEPIVPNKCPGTPDVWVPRTVKA